MNQMILKKKEHSVNRSSRHFSQIFQMLPTFNGRTFLRSVRKQILLSHPEGEANHHENFDIYYYTCIRNLIIQFNSGHRARWIFVVIFSLPFASFFFFGCNPSRVKNRRRFIAGRFAPRGRRDNKEAPAGESKQFDPAHDSGIVCLAANN